MQIIRHALAPLILCVGSVGPALAQDDFTLTSPAFVDGGDLPADLKCTRDGGDGLSPPLAWTDPPEGTESLAVIMQHYPRGRVEGVDTPSQYLLLWDIPAETRELPRGNPESLGNEGSDKDDRRTGYTSPCSPPGGKHEYTIIVYTLGAVPDLPDGDSQDVNWDVMTKAIEDKVIASSSISFFN